VHYIDAMRDAEQTGDLTATVDFDYGFHERLLGKPLVSPVVG
jgi:hypothetical protein